MFKAGKSGNVKGRPKGTVGGRAQALCLLDGFLAKSESKAALQKAFAADLKDNPMSFFKTVVMPLLPKESKLDVGHDGIIEWKSLLGDEPGELPRFDEKGLPIPGR